MAAWSRQVAIGSVFVEIDEIGRLVESEPEHLDQPHQRLIALAAEQQPVEQPVLLGKCFAAFGMDAHPGNDVAAARGYLRRRSSAVVLPISPTSSVRRISMHFLDLAQRAAETVGEIVEQRLEGECLDEDADAPPRLQHAERFQRLDAFAQRVPADAELSGKFPFRRQRRAGFETIFVDVGAQALLHGDVQQAARGAKASAI